MNIKKLVLSLGTIVTAGSVLAGATYALFTDTATASNNTFSTGSADLLLAKDAPTLVYLDNIPANAFEEHNLYPGFNKNYTLWLKNNSSAAFGLDVVAHFGTPGTSGNADVANKLNVTFTCTEDTNGNGTFGDGGDIATVAGPFSVNAWAAGSAPLGPLGIKPTVDADKTGPNEALCVMNVSLPSDLDNTYNNSSVSFDAVFVGTQHI